MLKKFIALKNVGRFKNSATVGNPLLTKFTLVHGANGYGKTTICAVLRSLQTSEPAHVIGRKTLGVAGPATIELLLEGGPILFNGAAWSAPHPHIAIFDGTFVAQNVFSGETVDLDQKRNLYRVIIGAEGLALAKEEGDCAAESRAKNGEMTAASKAIGTHLPAGVKLDQFIAITLDTDIEEKIAAQERKIRSIAQVNEIKTRPGPVEIALPDVPHDFGPLLGRTLEDIAADAELLVNDHVAKHKLPAASWIVDGMPYADKSCPFCGQDISVSSLITAYRALFSAEYKNFRAEIQAARTKIEQGFGEAAIARLMGTAEKNRAALDFWTSHCTLDTASLSLPAKLGSSMKALCDEVIRLATRKTETPLESIVIDAPFKKALDGYVSLVEASAGINEAVRAANIAIDAKKKETEAADLKEAQAALAWLKCIQTRGVAAVDKLCADYLCATGEKRRCDTEKEAARLKLEAHTKTVIKPYEKRINDYLESFNAGFSIAQTKPTYPGGVVASSYQIVINNIPVDVGDSSTPYAQPSFKNTLSAGDRSTLALAFFMAHLEKDACRAEKIVVFDDPFTSQDAFRRRQTVHEICKAAGFCKQVLVLSHDQTFLKQVWEKAPAADRVALQIVDARALGSKIQLMDIELACQGRVATELDHLQTYSTTGAGNPIDLIKKMRVVLETHCRSTYPANFQAADMLGGIVQKIRDSGEQHPAWTLYDDLDRVNDYSKAYHHGADGSDVANDHIDNDELTGYVRRSLRLVNALQA